MTEIIDLELADDLVKKPVLKHHRDQSSKNRAKRKGQLTFDDFQNIKIVEEPVVLSHNGSIEESLNVTTHTNKREANKGIDNDDIQVKKLKTNIVNTHSNIKTYPNDINKVELGNETNTNNRTLYTLNWSPNIPLRFSDFQDFVTEEKATENNLAPPFCVPLPYAGDVLKVLSFIAKFKWMFSTDLLNLSFQDVEIGLELVATDNYMKDVKLCQNKMNLLFCSLLRSLFHLDKASGSHAHKNFTLDRFLSLKNPYGKLVGKLRTAMREWGLPQEWRGSDDYLSSLNINGRGLLTMESSDRIILLRCMIDWNCSYSALFHNEIQRLTHIKGDTGFYHQTFHATRFSMYGATNMLDSCEILCSLMNRKLENRKKRKPHDYSKVSEINEQIKFLKDVQKSLKEKLTPNRLQAAVKINEEWSKHFANELSHTPIDDPTADEIYRLRESEFMIARIPKFGDFYLPPFRIDNRCNSTSTCYSFNDMATYVDFFIEFKKKGTMTLKKLPAKSMQPENNCQLKLIYNNTSACIRNILSSNACLNKAPHWFEVSGDSDSLIGFIEYLESLSLLEENIADDTKKSIDSLIEYLQILNLFINETVKKSGDAAAERAAGSYLRTNSGKSTRMHYSAGAGSDNREESESEIDIEVDDDHDSEYLSDESASDRNDDNRTSKYARKIEADNGTKDRKETRSDIEIFSEPIRQLHNDSRERRILRRNARRDPSFQIL